MALYCLISAGGSPGVTTTALGLALTWPGPVLLAECDPSHRSVLPGFLAERLDHPPGPGLLGLAMEAHHGSKIALNAIDPYTIALDGGQGTARLLHGIRDPRHAAQLKPLWPALADLFAATPADVIADLGCVGGSDTPMPLLARADLIVMVVRRTVAQVDAAQPRLEALRGAPIQQPSLCVINDGPYTSAAISKALFDLPVLGELPDAESEARVLSEGARPRRTFRTSLLVRTLNALGRRMRTTTENTPANTAGNTAGARVPGGAALVEPKPFGERA
ncbi:MAG TPA: hypothetical protein VGF32_12105 [Streptosporangiaceae bacterium]